MRRRCLRRRVAAVLVCRVRRCACVHNHRVRQVSETWHGHGIPAHVVMPSGGIYRPMWRKCIILGHVVELDAVRALFLGVSVQCPPPRPGRWRGNLGTGADGRVSMNQPFCPCCRSGTVHTAALLPGAISGWIVRIFPLATSQCHPGTKPSLLGITCETDCFWVKRPHFQKISPGKWVVCVCI